MKACGYLIVVLVFSLATVSDGFAASGQPSRNERHADKAAAMKGGHSARGQAPKNGAPPAAAGQIGGPASSGGKGNSDINGTGIGAPHSSSINGTGLGAQH